MKFRCTVTVDLDMPNEKDEEMVRAFLGMFTISSLAKLAHQKVPFMLLDDVKFVDCEARKIDETIHG